jgi:POT family proton-dependent oligopeptide transporter
MLALMFFGTLFWAFDMQVDSSITLFTDRIVDRTIFGWTIPTPMFQSINPFVIFSMGPILSWLWFKLNQRKINLCAGYKFSLALIQVGLGFLVLATCAHLFANTGHVSFLWVVFTYFLISTGELCCEPIGLASANHLPPRHLIGMMIAAWYLYTGSYANYLAAFIAKFTSVDEKIGLGDLHSASLVYGEVFWIIVWSSIGIGVFLAIATMITKKVCAKSSC